VEGNGKAHEVCGDPAGQERRQVRWESFSVLFEAYLGATTKKRRRNMKLEGECGGRVERIHMYHECNYHITEKWLTNKDMKKKMKENLKMRREKREKEEMRLLPLT